MEEAQAAIEIYEQISLNLLDLDLTQALEITSRLNLYAYDAYIIACALNQNCPLLTLDGGLSYAAKAAGIKVVEVSGTNADIS